MKNYIVQIALAFFSVAIAAETAVDPNVATPAKEADLAMSELRSGEKLAIKNSPLVCKVLWQKCYKKRTLTEGADHSKAYIGDLYIINIGTITEVYKGSYKVGTPVFRASHFEDRAMRPPTPEEEQGVVLDTGYSDIAVVSEMRESQGFLQFEKYYTSISPTREKIFLDYMSQFKAEEENK